MIVFIKKLERNYLVKEVKGYCGWDLCYGFLDVLIKFYI